MRLLFPEWFLSPSGDSAATGTSIELPWAAPETYKGLAGTGNTARVRAAGLRPWLGQSLSRAHIRTLDWTLTKRS